LVLLGVKFDILGLGEPTSYYKWEVLLLFFGIMALLNFKILFAVILFAIGLYFLLPEMAIQVPEIVKTIFWPSLLVLAGIDIMLKPLHCRKQ